MTTGFRNPASMKQLAGELAQLDEMFRNLDILCAGARARVQGYANAAEDPTLLAQARAEPEMAQTVAAILHEEKTFLPYIEESLLAMRHRLAEAKAHYRNAMPMLTKIGARAPEPKPAEAPPPAAPAVTGNRKVRRAARSRKK